jgi:hypothetical protein
MSTSPVVNDSTSRWSSFTAELPHASYLITLAIETTALTVLFAASREHREVLAAEPIGWFGLASMTAMQLYSVRRRVRALRRWGSLRGWLDWHIFMGIQGGLCITYHAARGTTWWSAAGTGLVLMWIVLLSGLFGRYLFALVPRAVTGDAMTAREIDAELRAIEIEVSPVELIDRNTGTWAAVRHARQMRRALREVEQRFAAGPDAPRMRELLARWRRLTARQPALLTAERALRWWLVFHRPLVLLLATAAMLHVIAHFAFQAMP